MRGRISLQHIVYLFLAAALMYVVWRYRDQLATILDVLRSGTWYLVFATILVLGIAVYNQALLYASIYDLLALPSRRREFLPLYLVKRFVQVAAPSGGFSGWVPFLQFARKRDISVGTVFVANLIYTILWYSTFGIFGLLGLLYLFGTHHLEWFETSASLIVLVADLALILLLVLAWVKPKLPNRIMRWIAWVLRVVSSWIRRPPPLSEQQLTTFACDLGEGVTQMQQAGWKRLLRPVAHAVTNETLHIGMFFLIALAFGATLSFGVLVAAYSISVLFWVVSPTPGGLGIVEGTLVIVLTALDVPAERAMVITLAYRGITFWLPFFLGFIALRWFNKQRQLRASEDEG